MSTGDHSFPVLFHEYCISVTLTIFHGMRCKQVGITAEEPIKGTVQFSKTLISLQPATPRLGKCQLKRRVSRKYQGKQVPIITQKESV